MKININTQIEVKLTKKGKQIYTDYNNAFNAIKIAGEQVKTKKKFILWEFMQIYGKYFYMGVCIDDSPIKKNIIDILIEDKQC